MKFEKPLQRWAYARREKRFFIYGQEEGQVAHCANTGSLRGVLENTAALWVADHGASTTRKLRYTAELAELHSGTLVGIHPNRANTLAPEALRAGVFTGLPPITELRTEVKYNAETRFDAQFTHPLTHEPWWVEVKSTTLVEEQGGHRVACFPDAVTTRGTKHLATLEESVRQGGHALQIYVVPRADATHFAPAAHIDPAYAAALAKAVAAGVQVVALGCEITTKEIRVFSTLQIML